MRKNLSIGFYPLRDDVEIPQIKTEGSAGADLVVPDDVVIPPFHTVGKGTLIPLGFALDIPDGMQVHIMLRSSIGKNTPLRLSNAVGLIDSDYKPDFNNGNKAEVCLLVDNLSRHSVVVKSGTRLAQLVPFSTLKWDFDLIVTHSRGRTKINPKSNTKRTGGFGSTTKGEVKKHED